ncbi:hypothetical protein QBC35DRAFT_513729 [Podospora australis]|uniref:MINDY deubiquitinase domain-containing protein n=1 Tax=Podospora australis TaxID=1536484 RepID=A0AAN7AKA7_9PEZI|nr:hypothetical protein QBC35DRAFT_513729 [Podospora australis]
MVARKPVPQNATFDPAVPSEARTTYSDSQPHLWSPANAEEEQAWGDERQIQNHTKDSTASSINDVPSTLRPGAASGYTGFEDENIWADRGAANGLDRVPIVLRPGSSHKMGSDFLGATGTGTADVTSVPAVLRPAGGAIKTETNPFKRKMQNAPAADTHDTFSTSAVSPTPPTLPPPVPFISAFSDLNINDSSKNPWDPAPSEDKVTTSATPPPPPPPVPALVEQDSGTENIWDSAKPSRQPTPGPNSKSPTLMSLPSEEGSADWDNEKPKDANPAKPFTAEEDEVLVEAHAWDDLGGAVGKGKAPAKASVASDSGAAAAGDDWNLIDMDPRPGPPARRDTWENFDEEEGSSKPAAPAQESKAQGKAPELPPRTNTVTEQPPQQPPRPVDKNETYQIKKINWYDVTAATNPRVSPILVQNANGPCPLVALVNALSLTTPADKPDTALVGALKSREQISIGLLLDAVFDELTSERRMQPGVPLPDITELYAFLQGLHTGMNVNPRYVPTPEVLAAFKRTSLTHLHPTERNDNMIPGTFEHTKEMALYSTFRIPLIHGWLPPHDDPVYDAFMRRAPSYEDAQNLLFREEELDEKLSSPDSQGLTEDEQQLYQDIMTIKSFLDDSATQLTKFGLETIRKSMKPGTVAILFRNDHFSTLYRHPQTLELHTLVTDMGFASHAEVVWESLVDLNGERAEFFSGDFRVVGGASHESPTRSRTQGSVTWADVATTDNGGWTTVQGRSGRTQRRPRSPEAGHPLPSPTREQEDRDLALALQLQEEEDERHRREQDRRRRESHLSEQYIEQQGRSPTSANRNGNSRGGGSNHGASRSTTSLGSATSGGTGRRTQGAGNGRSSSVRVTPASPAAALASSGNNNSNSSRTRAASQTVRSLIPPARPAVNRNPEDGVEDAPPSYEQASREPAYEPAAGHPSHPASSPTGSGPRLAPSTSASGATHRPTPSSPAPQQQGTVRVNRTPGPRASSGSVGNAAKPQHNDIYSPTAQMATSTVGLINNWYPPTAENYHFILSLWKWFPAAASLQWATKWYGMGKTSIPSSPLNIPGRLGWLTMECPGFLTLLYTFFKLPPQLGLSLSDLPYQNKVLAFLFVLHYSYRAVLYPLIQPSMSPLHLGIWLSGFSFQVINGLCLGSYLGGHGPVTQSGWPSTLQFAAGLAVFYVGLAANYYHDDELREIRRRENARQERLAKQSGQSRKSIEKHYEVPKAGLFKTEGRTERFESREEEHD